MIEFKCPHCGQGLSFQADSAGQEARCFGCYKNVQVPTESQAAPAPAGNEFAGLRDDHGPMEPAPTSYGGGEGNQAMGWIVFLLIFGVGNAILYATTGWLIIPIRR
jgi:hypothetical protein